MSRSTRSNDSSGTSSDESESSSSNSGSIHSEFTNESDSSTAESDGDSSQHEKLVPTTITTTTSHQEQRCPIRDPHVVETMKWTIHIPIRLGLCPWAIQSHRRSSLKIIACHGISPSDAARTTAHEIRSLTHHREEEREALRTTLVVCPNIEEWMEDFDRFDEFVKCGMKRHILSTTNRDMGEDVTLVAFHPKFEKWRALPQEVGVGSTIRSHYRDNLGRKSAETAEATIVEMENRAFGMRKVKVRFQGVDDGFDRRREQYVPLDWIVVPRPEMRDSQHCVRLPLPDNAMYRSPYPTIHIIDNRDLASLCVADVSRVKRLNARRMMRLGWKGLEKHIEKMKLADNVV